MDKVTDYLSLLSLEAVRSDFTHHIVQRVGSLMRQEVCVCACTCVAIIETWEVVTF